MVMYLLLETTKVFRLLSCPAAGSPPGLLDLTSPYSSGQDVLVFVGTELSLFFIASLSTFVLWRMQRFVTSQRRRRFVVALSVISALYFSAAAVMLGAYPFWGVAIAEWHVQAFTFVVKGVCSADAVASDYARVETMYERWFPIIVWVALLEVLLPTVIIVIWAFLRRRQRNATSNR